ncbi:NAD-dependent epimerase/dehydratase family protein [uncultured Draconibacterium sp.]|uniref:NAD-dependent epimerase/dehydratase family protein n=1 Tax=uncultured Draconibacterium sp. TaxID=1573823 RepID=UPI00321727E3
MNVIITGATGMVGKGVLLECLDHPSVDNILVIGRNRIDVEHPKLKELIHLDFTDFSGIKEQLTNYDACFFCMGISSAGMKEDEYKHITYDYTLSLAKTLVLNNPAMTFNYVSGGGTDSTEKGKVMWARVKGKTENDLLKLGFNQAFMFRPNAIIPLRGIKSKTKLYQFMYDYFMWMIKLMKVISPNSVVNTTQLGIAMINTALKGYKKSIIDPVDIIELSK